MIKNETFLRNRERTAQINSQQHRGGDADRRVDDAGSSGANDLMEVHAEAERHHGSLQKILREHAAFGNVGMRKSEAVEEAAEKSNGR